MRKLFFVSVLFVLFIGLSGIANATNGYFSNGYSIESKALAGAGVALPQGSIDASTNPAAMAFVGKRIDFGLTLFNPNREFTVTGNPSPAPAFGLAPGTVESDSEYFLVPSLGANWVFDEYNSVGISIFGNGGMNTDYATTPVGVFGGTSPTGVDLMQLFIAPTYARKLNPKHAVGITPILAYQRFEATGLQAFAGFSSSAANLTNNGHESAFGYGVRIGYLGEILPNLNLGLAYQTKIYMGELDGYKGLFAEQGDFDIPSNWTVGLAFKPMPELAFAFDVQQIYYSEVDSIANPLMPNLLTAQLGSDQGAGFGWDDMTIYKLGVQWQSSKDWIWRAGYSFGNQPIGSSEVLFNILAPGVIEQHASVGVTRNLGTNHAINFSLVRAFSKDVTGPNPLDPAQTIKLQMDQWEVSLGYTYKF